MSGLNDSVIICDALSNSREKEVFTKNKNQQKIKKKTFYENSLKYIQLSSKRSKKKQAQQELKYQKKEVDDNKNNYFSSDIVALNHDSIITLSDNECESTNKDNKNICKHKEDIQTRFLDELEKTIRSYKKTNKSVKRKISTIMTRSRKRRALNSGVLIDNNSSCLHISDAEDPDIVTVEVDDENIAPMDSINQSSDDVTVVWSSANKTLSNIQLKENKVVNAEMNENKAINEDEKRESSEEIASPEKNDRLFMIDHTPEPKNLQCLTSKKERCKMLKDNIEERIQKDNTKLLFNKPGLKLPTAQNISERIIMKKRKSIFIAISNLNEKTSELRMKTALPGTSNGNNANNIGVPPNNRVKENTDTSHTRLREIIVDGNNVAMAHSNGKLFSEEGLEIVINYFKERGHTVKVFVPQYRRSVNKPRLEKWYSEGIVIFTPSRYIAGRWITSYDDRFILQYATMCKGIVISLDQYRDLYNEKIEWRDTIVNRLLAPTFVGNIVMFPDDPLGRNGPTLDEFLRHKV